MVRSRQSGSAARAAGLRYVSDFDRAIRRERRGKGFVYVGPSGKRVRNEHTLARIRSLVIPPAWENVRICPDPRGHIQAIGWDKRGRKQYKYHPKWRESRDETKYERMIDFARVLPAIRRRVRRDLRLPALPREKILATVVRLLETTLIRIGNAEYARENHSFGLTTLRNRHVHVNGNAIHFEFRGKSGVERTVDLQNPRLARIVRACQHLPGQELFQFVDSAGVRHPIASDDVNEYLHEIAGSDITAKDFRTWSGTVLAAKALLELGKYTSQRQAKKNAVAAIKSVARELGNTVAVSRKCYIHPAILNGYISGTLLGSLSRPTKRSSRGLHAEELSVLALLKA